MDAQTITAICAGVIALAAIGLTAWQACVTRKHNRLSVRPHLCFYRNIAPGIQIVLKNSGIGPAFITDYKLFIDDQPIVESNVRTYHNSVAEKLEIPEGNLQILLPDCKGAIASNKELVLLSTDITVERPVLLKKADRLSIEVDYESVYGENFKVQLNNDE